MAHVNPDISTWMKITSLDVLPVSVTARRLSASQLPGTLNLLSTASLEQVSKVMGYATLELPCSVLEIPNDVFTKISQTLIGCSTSRLVDMRML